MESRTVKEILDDLSSLLGEISDLKDGENYLRYLTDDEFSVLQKTESYEDEYTDMWKTLFHAISIEQRKNYVCQRNLFPIWKRKHAVEFR